MDENLRVFTVPQGHPYYAKRELNVYAVGDKWKVKYRLPTTEKWDEYYDTELQALRVFHAIATRPERMYCESEGEFLDVLSNWADGPEVTNDQRIDMLERALDDCNREVDKLLDQKDKYWGRK